MAQTHPDQRVFPLFSDVDRMDNAFSEMVAAGQVFATRRMSTTAASPADAYEHAIQQRQEIAAKGSAGIRESSGIWRPLGKGSLDLGDPQYPDSSFTGWPKVSARVDDFAYDADHDRVFAAVGTGGVWESKDHGRTWRSIGDTLPTQSVGSVAYTPAGGGAILALSREADVSTFFPEMALGAFRSTNNGRTWIRSKGLPSGGAGFNLAVDPAHPSTVYAATGSGLFRSTDAGRSFTNVRLPTGSCAGSTRPGPCFLANVVTDVVIQGHDRHGHRGGTVLAAVGWIWGDLPGPSGKPQAPYNGLYRSESGRPGTFEKVPDRSGFAASSHVGRVELASAEGPKQDSRFVYAVVQDPQLMQGDVPVDILGNPASPYPLPTNVNGVFVSADFGRTWTKMIGTAGMLAPTTGSSLSPSWIVGSPLADSPVVGYQAWYNETIRVDPTRQSPSGIPTRVVFGLEEIWRNANTSRPQDGRSRFVVIGRYAGNHECNFIRLTVCPFNKDLYTGPTTHPDQHASLFVPEGDGGVTLLAGSDGGVFRQQVGPGEELDNTKWGTGSQTGFHTLLVYNAAVAKDGVVYAGTQDNGTMRVGPDGRQLGVFSFDGYGVAVDPNNSDVAYQTIQYGKLHTTTDGGHSWKSITPGLAGAPFWTPYAMDPKDPNHLIAAGNDVKETIFGPQTNSADQTDLFDNPVVASFPEDGYDPTSQKNWATVFQLGSRASGDVIASAVALSGAAAYVGGCAHCQPVTDGTPFSNVLATNVGGAQPRMSMTKQGWHVASAKGLPRRFITSIRIDAKNPRVVYVTLGGYYSEVEPGSFGEDTSGMAGGHVYRSTDAGEHFRDISGNLPDAPANWLAIRKGQLIVATDIGVFIAKGTTGGTYALLGRGLPIVPVMSLQLKPGDSNLLLAATYGRGLYTYRFP